jgi:hypothetical protein
MYFFRLISDRWKQTKAETNQRSKLGNQKILRLKNQIKKAIFAICGQPLAFQIKPCES